MSPRRKKKAIQMQNRLVEPWTKATSREKASSLLTNKDNMPPVGAYHPKRLRLGGMGTRNYAREMKKTTRRRKKSTILYSYDEMSPSSQHTSPVKKRRPVTGKDAKKVHFSNTFNGKFPSSVKKAHQRHKSALKKLLRSTHTPSGNRKIRSPIRFSLQMARK